MSITTLCRARFAALLAAAAVASAAPGVLAAQRTSPASLAGSTSTRFEAGGGLEYAQAVSQFRQNVKGGFGGGGHFIIGIDPAHVLGLRVDASFATYGNETQYFPINSAFRRITLAEETSNNIIVASVGPQLTVPVGPVRPYVNGGVGLAYFYTQTSLKDNNDATTLAQTTNYSDNSLAYTGGAGIYVPFSVGRQTVSVDVGARYNAIGTTRYLTKGDIVDDPNNPNGIIITPHQSDARFVTYHLGVAVSF